MSYMVQQLCFNTIVACWFFQQQRMGGLWHARYLLEINISNLQLCCRITLQGALEYNGSSGCPMSLVESSDESMQMWGPRPWAWQKQNCRDPSIFRTGDTAAYKGFDSVYTLHPKDGDWSFHKIIRSFHIFKLIFQFHIQETIPMLYQANKKWVV